MAKLATIAAFGFPDFNPSTLLKVYRRLGCATGQFYRNPNNPPDVADAKRIAESAGLSFDSIHGVFGPAYDPSSPDEAIRLAAIETYHREGDLALEVGGPMVVVHPAPMAKNAVTPQSQAARIEPLRRSLQELARIGERSGVTYLIENIPPNYEFGSDVAQLARLIRELNHPRVRMCFDTGHAYMVGDPAAALETARDVVSYCHVHDNNGLTDSHHIPGTASLPWSKFASVMAKLPINTPAMLELFQSEAVMEEQLANGLPDKLQAWLALE